MVPAVNGEGSLGVQGRINGLGLSGVGGWREEVREKIQLGPGDMIIADYGPGRLTFSETGCAGVLCNYVTGRINESILKLLWATRDLGSRGCMLDMMSATGASCLSVAEYIWGSK